MLYWGIVYRLNEVLHTMPLYEYVCKDCGESFEMMVRFTEGELKQSCPNCAGSNTHKKISRVGAFGPSSSDTSSSTGTGCGSSSGFS
jgi:putative FmdB family regulatory protein